MESSQSSVTSQENTQSSSSPETKASLPTPPGFFTRLVSGAVYVGIIVAAIFLGKVATAILMSVFAGVAAFELYRMARIDGKNPNMLIGVVAAVLYPYAALTGSVYLNLVTLALIVAVCFWFIIDQRARLADIAITVFGALYTGLMISAMVLIRSAGPDWQFAVLTLGVFMSVWANDSFAYLFGSLLGKHKMVPKISPKKSWEGFFAGIVGSVLIWVVLSIIPGLNLSLPLALVGGLACGVVGVIGDLVESRIKRGTGVKDSGNIIPGHGGILDRTDSLLMVGITAYFVLILGGVL